MYCCLCTKDVKLADTVTLACPSLLWPLACRSLFPCSPHLPIWVTAVVLIWHAAPTSKAFSLDSSAVLVHCTPPPSRRRNPQLPMGLSLVLAFSQRRWRQPDEKIRILFIWIPHVLLIRKPLHKPVRLIPYSLLWLRGQNSRPGTWQLTPTCMLSSARNEC